MEPKTVRRVKTGHLNARHVKTGDVMNALPLGTVIQTLDGAMPVEFLETGDRVVTRNCGYARLRALRSFVRKVPAIRIKPGSLGNMRPDCEVFLPETHEILVRDWRASAIFGASQALVPAVRLSDGEFIKPVGDMTLHLFELVFDAPQIVYADGLELASAQAIHA